MKKHLLIAAITLLIAAPAAAQTAPAAPQHQGHGQPATHDMSQMSAEEMARMGHTQQGQPQHDQHQGHAMGDCCKDENGNGRMDCCENTAQGESCCAEHQPATPAQPQRQPNR